MSPSFGIGLIGCFWQEIRNGEHRIIITSPEMCLLHEDFRSLISEPTFAKKICTLVIDEAHCIRLWGEKKFREMYEKLGTLRAFVPHKVPMLVTSATLTPLDLARIQETVHLCPLTTYHINLGNDRSNITWNVRRMNAGKSDANALDFLLPKDPNALKLDRGLVFFDDINVAMDFWKTFTAKVAPHQSIRVDLLHSRRGAESKGDAYDKFCKGELDILFCTEVAGMVRYLFSLFFSLHLLRALFIGL